MTGEKRKIDRNISSRPVTASGRDRAVRLRSVGEPSVDETRVRITEMVDEPREHDEEDTRVEEEEVEVLVDTGIIEEDTRVEEEEVEVLGDTGIAEEDTRVEEEEVEALGDTGIVEADTRVEEDVLTDPLLREGEILEEDTRIEDPVDEVLGHVGGDQASDPLIVDTIKYYNTHVASDIWEGIERGVLRVHRHLPIVDQWTEVVRMQPDGPGTWLSFARRSGLVGLHEIDYRIADCSLISAFVERWYPETNNFHFPWGEITITLHDVVKILGLQIDGDMLTCTSSRDTLIAMFEGMFDMGGDDVRKQIKEGGIRLRLLDERVTRMRRDGLFPEHVVSGYLLILISSTLFLDKSTNRVKHHLLDVVRDHERTGTLSWGSAVLADLYRKLGKASRAGCAQLDGCTILLQCWIWCYFPALRGASHPDPDRHGSGRFALRAGPRPHGLQSDESVRWYRVQLDRCRAEDVILTPFGSIDFVTGPLHLSRYRGLIGHFERYEPYMPDRVLRQFGRVQCVPVLELIEPASCKRPRKGGYELTFTQGHHWATRYEHLYDIFQHGEVVSAWDVDEHYYDWFEPRTHMYVSRDAIRHDPPVPHHPAPVADAVRRLQILTGVLREFRRGPFPMTLHAEQFDHMIEIATGDTAPVAPPPLRASQRDRAGPSGH